MMLIILVMWIFRKELVEALAAWFEHVDRWRQKQAAIRSKRRQERRDARQEYYAVLKEIRRLKHCQTHNTPAEEWEEFWLPAATFADERFATLYPQDARKRPSAARNYVWSIIQSLKQEEAEEAEET